MQTLLRYFLMWIVVPAASTLGEENALLSHSRDLHGGVTAMVVEAASRMPAESYDFRPVESVRTFGEIVRHIAETNDFFCAAASGEPGPRQQAARTASGKQELVAALRESFAKCAQVHAALTDASASEMVNVMGRPRPRLSVLTIHQLHAIEHYGNLVTYLRMQKIVPPTSDAEFMKQLR